MQKQRLLSQADLIAHITKKENSHLTKYYAMYSSWLGGIITDSRFMMIPIDDHMVHRGDGVFEAFKAKNSCLFLLEEHLDRLLRSCAAIELKPPFPRDQIRQCIIDTALAANKQELLMRLFISRGPGDFSPDPMGSVGSQLYIIATELRTPTAHHYQHGITAGYSRVESKTAFFAQIKSCNYLPNVLMKMEARRLGYDLMIGVDQNSFVLEGATENFAIINADNVFRVAPFEQTLRGTTVQFLIENIKANKWPELKFDQSPLSQSEISQCREAFFIGTTIDVLPVTKINGHAVGAGRVGKWTETMNEFLHQTTLTPSPFSILVK